MSLFRRFVAILESIAREMPRVVSSSVQILAAVEEIVLRVVVFSVFLYGLYRLVRH